jgi:hypothetical protein
LRPYKSQTNDPKAEYLRSCMGLSPWLTQTVKTLFAVR